MASLSQLSVSSTAPSDVVLSGPDTKFLCDPTLSRLCRWMRVLGKCVSVS